MPTPKPVQRGGRDAIEPLIARQRIRQQIAQRSRQRLHLPVFEKMNQLPKLAIVIAEAISGVEPS